MISKKQNIDFGIVLTLVLLVVGLVYQNDIFYKIAVVTLLITALFPTLYFPFSWLWYKFAKGIEITFSTVLLFLLFYLLVTPVGLFRRCFAKDTLSLRGFKKDKKSIFVQKNKKYLPEDMENQF